MNNSFNCLTPNSSRDGVKNEELWVEFGDDKNIIGWQLDNEIYAFGTGCVCAHCMKKYHASLFH